MCSVGCGFHDVALLDETGEYKVAGRLCRDPDTLHGMVPGLIAGLERGANDVAAALAFYSLLSAIAGSTRVARTAGTPHAAMATTMSMTTARSDEMSNVPTP
jgi:hypothetical protein